MLETARAPRTPVSKRSAPKPSAILRLIVRELVIRRDHFFRSLHFELKAQGSCKLRQKKDRAVRARSETQWRRGRLNYSATLKSLRFHFRFRASAAISLKALISASENS